MLSTDVKGKSVYAAGVPWFVTLFGRDSILTAFQMLAFDAANG
jgi:glycogen debranching enzyme